MTPERITLFTLAPLGIFVSLRAGSAARKIVGVGILLLGFGLALYSMYLKSGPSVQAIVPNIIFILLISFQIARKEKYSFFFLLGAIYSCQSLLSDDLGVGIILLFTADFLYLLDASPLSEIKTEELASKMFASAVSYLPPILALQLNFQNDLLRFACFISILLRVFSWPFHLWWHELIPSKRLLRIGLSLVPALALAKHADFSAAPIWACWWLVFVSLESLGAKLPEVISFLFLGAVTLFPGGGFWSAGLWPLVFGISFGLGFTFISTALVGALISQQMLNALNPEASTSIAIVSAIGVARSWGQIKLDKEKWIEDVAYILLSGATIGYFIFNRGWDGSQLEIPAFSYISAFILFSGLSFYFRNSKPSWFRLSEAVAPQIPTRLVFPSERRAEFRLKENVLSEMGQGLMTLVLDLTQSQAAMAWLLGLSGLALAIWGGYS